MIFKSHVVMLTMLFSWASIQAQNLNNRNNNNTIKDTLEEVIIHSKKGRKGTAVVVIENIKNSHQVVSGISAQQIAKMQDPNASEVLKRISGVTIMDNRFVIIRGLSQRYNNVWLNHSPVPSTESDSRSFSFDLIPSSQIDNILILKSPSPEIPADFSGGFIFIKTKGSVEKNEYQANVSTIINTSTHFKRFQYNQTNIAKAFGFDGNQLGLRSIVPFRVDNTDPGIINTIAKQGFNNNWGLHSKDPLPDIRFSFNTNNIVWGNGISKIFSNAAINYTNQNRITPNMTNARFGIYDAVNDMPIYDYKYKDNIYNNNVRLGGTFGLVYAINNNHTIEIAEVFNQMATNQLTLRNGYRNISTIFLQEQTEYNYSSRTMNTINVSGNHKINTHRIDWVLSYSYANKNQPDRRIIERDQDTDPESEFFGQFRLYPNGITRDFIALNEHIISGALNTHFKLPSIYKMNTTLLAGFYGEYKSKNYTNRTFLLRWDEGNFPLDFFYQNVYSQILLPQNYGKDKLYFYEETDNRNSYKANQFLSAAYVALNMDILKKINIYWGIRAENNLMQVINYTSLINFKTITRRYPQFNIFPSINVSYAVTKNQKIRVAYGMSINRQDLRELSPSVYYDFDLFSNVAGNINLKPAKIQNIDLRYEWYPSSEENISGALFYKYFTNPIEQTYYDAGGSYTYSFENAKSANNVGIELDIRKNFDFLGINNLMFLFNGSYIYSRVQFNANSLQVPRPMQGQSPYIINAGFLYSIKKISMDITIIYNRIGERLINVGRVDKTTSGAKQLNNTLPDIYEMPRNILDITVNKKINKYVEVRFAARDVLNAPIVFKQFPKFYDTNGTIQSREQTTRYAKIGTNVMLMVVVNF